MVSLIHNPIPDRFPYVTFSYILLTALSFTGFYLILYITENGVGCSPDSSYYLMAARNLLIGDGLNIISPINGQVSPLTHYPPFYTVIVALTGLFGGDVLEGVRYINALLFTLNILLSGIIVANLTNDKPLFSLIITVFSSIFLMTSYCFILIHSFALTEPLFISLFALAFFLLGKYFARKNYIFLLTAAIFISLAFLTRYVGITLIITSLIIILIYDNHNILKKVSSTIFFLAISCLPIFLWMLRNYSQTGGATSRTIMFHPPSYSHYKSFITGFGNLLIPFTAPIIVKLIVSMLLILLIIGITVIAIWNLIVNSTSMKHKIVSLFVFYPIVYLLFLIVSITWFDYSTYFDGRILCPVYFCIIISASFLIYQYEHFIKQKSWILGGLISIAAFLLLINSYSSVKLIHKARENSLGYANKETKDAAIFDFLIKYSYEKRIYSNSPELIYILTKRNSRYIPRKIDPTSNKLDDKYYCELLLMEESIKNCRGIMIWFNHVTWNLHLPEKREIMENCRLKIIYDGPEGSIYGCGENLREID